MFFINFNLQCDNMDEILKNLVDGKISIEECKTLIKSNSIMELEGIAQLDSSRKNRTGFPEAIFAEGKEYKDLLAILKRLN